MATKSSRPHVSRRTLLQKSAAAIGGAAAVLGGGAAAQQRGAAPAAPAVQAGAANPAGRRFRAWVRHGTTSSVEELRLRPIEPRQVVVRTEATQCCYTVTTPALGTDNVTPRVVGHGGVGIVEAVGAQVRRLRVGDRAIVAINPNCGECFQCVRGRGEWCQFLVAGNNNPVFATMSDGTEVGGGRGGFSEIMVAYEEWCLPIFSSVSSLELSLFACVGSTGLGPPTTFVPVEAGSNVVVFGAGPIGLSMIQGARIMGASQIISVEPIRYRRELALKLGATLALDPNVEGNGIVEKVRDLFKGPTERLFAGGRFWAPPAQQNQGGFADSARGADFVFEAVGGNRFPPKVEVGPDPDGVLPLQQAWSMVREGGHLITVGVGQTGNVTFPAGQWTNRGKTHWSAQFGGVNLKRDVPRFIALVERGLFDAKSIASATFPLERSRDAFQACADRTTVSAHVVIS